MRQGVDINKVKEYNAALNQYREQGTKLRAEISVNEKELASICEQLSAELGITVNADNLEQIYDAKVAEIENTLKTGIEIMQRIQQEAGQSTGQASTQEVNQQVLTGMRQANSFHNPVVDPRQSGIAAFENPVGMSGVAAQQMDRQIQATTQMGSSEVEKPESAETGVFGTSPSEKTLFNSNTNPVSFPGFDI